jgi:hypothetical protein
LKFFSVQESGQFRIKDEPIFAMTAPLQIAAVTVLTQGRAGQAGQGHRAQGRGQAHTMAMFLGQEAEVHLSAHDHPLTLCRLTPYTYRHYYKQLQLLVNILQLFSLVKNTLLKLRFTVC